VTSHTLQWDPAHNEEADRHFTILLCQVGRQGRRSESRVVVFSLPRALFLDIPLKQTCSSFSFFILNSCFFWHTDFINGGSSGCKLAFESFIALFATFSNCTHIPNRCNGNNQQVN